MLIWEKDKGKSQKTKYLLYGRGAFFKSTKQDMAGISECFGKEKMPKLR
jgi:hypothetical protein